MVVKLQIYWTVKNSGKQETKSDIPLGLLESIKNVLTATTEINQEHLTLKNEENLITACLRRNLLVLLKGQDIDFWGMLLLGDIQNYEVEHVPLSQLWLPTLREL